MSWTLEDCRNVLLLVGLYSCVISVRLWPSSYYYRTGRGRQGVKTKQLAWCDALPSSDYSTHNDHNLVVCHINCSGRKSGEARPWSLFLIAIEPLTLWKSWRTDFLPWVALFNYIIFLLLNYGTLTLPQPSRSVSVSEDDDGNDYCCFMLHSWAIPFYVRE